MDHLSLLTSTNSELAYQLEINLFSDATKQLQHHFSHVVFPDLDHEFPHFRNNISKRGNRKLFSLCFSLYLAFYLLEGENCEFFGVEGGISGNFFMGGHFVRI